MKMNLRNNRGWSTLYALFAIVIVSIAIGVCMSTTSSTLKLIQRGRDYTGARIAAEGAIEYAWGAWKNSIQTQGGVISTTAATTLVSGSTVLNDLSGSSLFGLTYDSGTANLGSCSGTLQIQAVDAYGVPTSSGTPAPVPVSLADYPGWTGITYNYLASVRFVSSDTRDNPNPVTAGGKRFFQYTVVPIFQAMFFYQDNLEIYDPAKMTVGGLVHTNSNLFLSATSSSTLTFTGNVSYSGTYYPGYGGGLASSGTSGTPPPGAESWSNVAMATPTYGSTVTQVPQMYPLGTGTSSANSVLSSTSSNPNINDGLHELIDPETTPLSTYPDPSQIANYRLYNQAGLIVKISGTSSHPTVSVTAANGTSLTTAQTTAVASAVTSKSTMYDMREGKNVNVDNVDMGTLSSAITGTSAGSEISGFNGIVYIYDTTSSSTDQTIRLQDGGTLPGGTSATSYYTKGLSMVSDNPVYVQGDYNTGATSSTTSNVPTNTGTSGSPTVPNYNRVPAAVMADAVVLLSNAWSDSNASNTNVTSRNASNTTYNMAILAGVVPSTSSNYSGGANNYPRFLEDWSGNTCTYYGSMAELFNSDTFTGPWDTGNIYSPPSRYWFYDTNFSQANGAPPGTLHVITYTRGSWQKF